MEPCTASSRNRGIRVPNPTPAPGTRKEPFPPPSRELQTFQSRERSPSGWLQLIQAMPATCSANFNLDHQGNAASPQGSNARREGRSFRSCCSTMRRIKVWVGAQIHPQNRVRSETRCYQGPIRISHCPCCQLLPLSSEHSCLPEIPSSVIHVDMGMFRLEEVK